MLIVALSGRMVCKRVLVNIVFVREGGGAANSRRDVFFADPGVGFDERKQHKMAAGF